MTDLQDSPASGEKPANLPAPRAAPGWYPDPEGSPAPRWWDGTRWTDARLDGQAPLPYPPPPASYPMNVKTNGLAVASLICSCAGYFTIGISAVVGVVLGYRARMQIRQSGGAEQGDGLAKAGIIVGYIMIGLWLIVMVGLGLADSGA